MNLYVQEWPDTTASVMINNGELCIRFNNIDLAVDACEKLMDSYGYRFLNPNRNNELSSSTMC